MNDKIEEIINDLQRVADRKCYPEDILCGSIAQEWIDYITNLQESEAYYYGQYKDYKSRIEKALHLITHSDITDYRVFDEELINILRGEE